MLADKKRELYGPPRVGGDTLSYCGKCKMELAHVIVSMVDNLPAKVTCKTCKGQHKFRGVPGASRGRSAAAKGLTARPERVSMKAAELWEKRMGETKTPQPKDYDVKGIYLKDEVIQHKNFGVGIVEEVRLNGKLIVLFREGEKILISKHGSAPDAK